MLLRAIVLLNLLLLTIKANAQNHFIPEFLPSSPNSSELGKYGDIPVGFSTGRINLNIPLMEFRTKHLTLPINLSYSSNGFRVNEYSSRVGIDWVLNAGGVITRTVFDEDDFSAQRLPIPNFQVRNNDLLDFLNSSVSGGIDNEPDIFRYNFANYSGKFIIDDTGIPRCIPQNNLKIEYTTGLNRTFVVTTPDGVKYFFGGTNATESTKVSSNSDCGGAGHVAGTDNFIDNSWYLIKIEHPLGDVINLQYTSATIFYRGSLTQKLVYNIPSGPGSGGISDDPETSCENYIRETDKICFTRLEAKVCKLVEINSVEGKITFNYKPGFEGEDVLYDYFVLYDTFNNRLKKIKFEHQNIVSSSFFTPYNTPEDLNRTFLSKIYEYGALDSAPKIHQFSYKDLSELPPRFSFAQDYGGFYNGKNNTVFVPLPEDSYIRGLFNNKGGNRSPDDQFAHKGILEKVIYPTGGESQFLFEGHDSFVTETIPGSQSSLAVNVTGTDDSYFNQVEHVENSKTILIEDNQLAKLDMGFHHINNIIDGDSHIKLIVEVTDSVTNQVILSETLSQNQNQSRTISLQKNKTYILHTKLFGYDGFYGFANLLYETASQEVSHNKKYPGIRISKVINKTQPSANAEITKYIYGYLNEPTKSSGKSNRPIEQYFDTFVYMYQCMADVYKLYGYHFLYSNSLSAGGMSGESLINYVSVLTSKDEIFSNGGKEYIYSHATDLVGATLMGRYLLNTPFKNSGYNNGLLLEENTFKTVSGNNVYNKKIKNYYKTDNRIYHKVTGLAIRKNADAVHQLLPSPPPDNFFEPFDVTSYEINCYWDYLEKTEVADFGENGLSPVLYTTSYYYESPLHMMCTKEEKTSSINGLLLSKNTYYPHDMVANNKDPQGTYQGMINRNMIAEVVEEKNNVNNQQVSLIKRNFIEPYSGIYVPGSIHEWNSQKNIDELVYSYDKYDDKGNVLESRTKGGMPISYIWSYKGLYPIAEIKNVGHATVSSILGQSSLDSFLASTPTDTDVNAFLSPLRASALLKDAQATSFTYKPLIGMSSQTDSKGMKTYYEYDDFGRLKLIKDQQGNIINRFSYHYEQ